ncbi:hypothetical protein WJX72_007311 [[Myrmecia] bisecta]|uniref:Ubiquitin-like domain-containing protein n=1 Tax=[Myrmecia] bisecta TaxID=41462 RepID=A0AAW1P9U2_9CHLO
MERHKQVAEDLKGQEARAECGDSCELCLRLPDGVEESLQCQMGQTVQYLKAVLQEKFGHPMNKQTLTCNGRVMLDPLSLSDCSGIAPGNPNLIEVQVA